MTERNFPGQYQEQVMENSGVDLQTTLERLLSNRGHIELLEAGCGSICKIPLDNDITITGIDISEKQLERNNKLDIKVLGDIQTYHFQEEAYDVIACRFVLEHLKEPAKALNNLCRALRKDGILILTVPNIFSLKGLVTRFTPLWFHTFFYRYIYRWERIHEEEIGPFKTYLRLSMCPRALIRFARRNNFDIVYQEYYDALDCGLGEKLKQAGAWLFWMARTFLTFLRIISLGQLRESEFLTVFQKKA